MMNRDSHFPWIVCGGIFAVVLAVGTFDRVSAEAQPKGAASAAEPGVNTMTEQAGFYCNLNALSTTERERQKELTGKLREARIETKEMPDGYAFQLRSEKVSLAELAEWVGNERKCCPFFDFDIALERDGGPLWLKLRGWDGVKQFIRSEFGVQ
jgi:hypothetical protein